ncbi:MAG: COX15/CtaA family protein [Anaerolineae bacterium]|jgi:heme A synthase
MLNRSKYATYAWATVVMNVVVILWGAVVRATGSGAGCGNSWPDCGGTFIPVEPQTATAIEFVHRVTSGTALLMVLGLLVIAFRRYPEGSGARKGAAWSTVFILVEALVGAGLVLFDLVEDNESLARAVVMALHLANTMLLLGSLTLTAWWMAGGPRLRWRGRGSIALALGASLVGVVLLGMTGAVTALADTLYKAETIAQGLALDVDAGSPLLVRIRWIHPALAVIVAVVVLLTATYVRRERPLPLVDRFASTAYWLAIAQVVLGAVNLALATPVWMQVVHLAFADALWIALVLLSAATLADVDEGDTGVS